MKETKCHRFWLTGVNPITMKKDENPEDYLIMISSLKRKRALDSKKFKYINK